MDKNGKPTTVMGRSPHGGALADNKPPLNVVTFQGGLFWREVSLNCNGISMGDYTERKDTCRLFISLRRGAVPVFF